MERGSGRGRGRGRGSRGNVQKNLDLNCISITFSLAT